MTLFKKANPKPKGKKPTPNNPSQRKWIWRVVFILIFIGFLSYIWLHLGQFLVTEDTWEKSKYALILDGQDRDCERTDEAVRLYRLGKINTILLSTHRIYKNRYSSEFLIPLMVSQGIPRAHIQAINHDAYSTIEEALAIRPYLRNLNADTILIITSNYHTTRSKWIFNQLYHGDPLFLVQPANFTQFKANIWWKDRESIKCLLFEYLKFIGNFWELW